MSLATLCILDYRIKCSRHSMAWATCGRVRPVRRLPTWPHGTFTFELQASSFRPQVYHVISPVMSEIFVLMFGYRRVVVFPHQCPQYSVSHPKSHPCQRRPPVGFPASDSQSDCEVIPGCHCTRTCHFRIFRDHGSKGHCYRGEWPQLSLAGGC